MGLFERGKKDRQGKDASNAKRESNELTLEQANPITQSLIARLGYPYQIFSSKAAYEEVMGAYRRAVMEGQREGFTPLLVPSDDTLDDHLSILADEGYSVEDTLKAELVDGRSWLKRYPEELTVGEEDGDKDGFDGLPMEVDRYTAFLDFRSKGIAETILLKVPTTKPWELVAYVPFGGWNACPEAETMMAVCRYWYERYGAIPVTISHDVMEMRISAPIAAQDAMEVAEGHFAFCPDRVTECTETMTVSELAACIAVSRIWYFWWD